MVAATRLSALAADCRIFREAIELYYHQHNETYPGERNAADGNETGTKVEAEISFRIQLTTYTDSLGDSSQTPNPGSNPYGKYLKKIPKNPINGKSSVAVIYGEEGWPETADDVIGWIFDPASGRLAPNAAGTDRSGTAYFDY